MKEIVYTPGVWDLLHIGHLNIIKRAKLCGEHLIVGVCSDEKTLKTKGAYPAITERNRAELLSAIELVDEVYIYDNLNQSEQLSMFNVNVFVVGEEFGDQGVSEHQEAIEYCIKNEIKIVRVKRFKGISTTKIKNNLNEK
jgi:cytidyltransferase-like protein